MKKVLIYLLLCLFVVGCTYMRPIEKVSTPLKIVDNSSPSIDSFRFQLNILTPGKTGETIDVNSLRQRITEAFALKGITLKNDSPNYLDLDVNRFMIVGSGLIYCQSVVEMTTRAKVRGKVLKPKNFSASRNGHFCMFGNTTEKMKEQTKFI